MYLLKNGTIIDGSGNDAFKGIVVIDKDKIVDVVKDGIKHNYRGKEIDCSNKIIAPGFIDAHSHNDFFAVIKDNKQYFETFIKQGVTTMITGNCGFSMTGFPKGSKYHHLVGGGLFSNSNLKIGRAHV